MTCSNLHLLLDMKPFSVWWSRHRLDYLLKSSLTTIGYDSLPLTAITHIIHSSYWEAKEVVSFILRQVSRNLSLLTSLMSLITCHTSLDTWGIIAS